MKLTSRGEYALRALVFLGLEPAGVPVKIGVISHRERIPKRFLEQILNELRSYGWVESKRGAAGGYRLRVRTDQINLADIVRAIEGPLAPLPCVSSEVTRRCSCPGEAQCGVRSVMQEVRDALEGVLAKVTLAQLCERTRLLRAQSVGLTDYAI